MLSDFMQMNLLIGSYSQAEVESNVARQQVIGILYLAVYGITGITFLKWTHRANSNCHNFGAKDMKFTPGWSVGWYFIPVVFLWAPYQAMKEIWKVSKNPSDWSNETGSPLLGWWWTFWLLSNFLGHIASRTLMSADTINALNASTTVSIIFGIVDIPLYIIAVSLIATISLNQEKLVNKGVGVN